MKQKSNDSSILTRTELKNALKDYPTKKDLKNELKKFATKDDLTNSQNAFRQEMRYEFSMMKEEVRQEMSQFTNRVLTAIDPLLKELETRQQEREMAAAEMREVKADINHLQTRVTKLEHS